ncbi:hypothetical protein AMJ51_00650 [Microgenomates bacterium DG_75]|nr:MAG: hypothetical protein AMJ51_00650 [Microgenomates bacterium DG_75]
MGITEALQSKTLKELAESRSAHEREEAQAKAKIQVIDRARARIINELNHSLEELFPNRELDFEEVKIGTTKKALGYPKGKKGEVPPKVEAYYCPGCEGWVKGMPNREYMIEKDVTKNKAQVVKLSCRIDGHSLGNLEGSTSARNKVKV